MTARPTIDTARAEADIAWFLRTGHCGGCGQPATYCLCTDKRACGCRDHHPMGTGIGTDPTVQFAVKTGDEQPELFT